MVTDRWDESDWMVKKPPIYRNIHHAKNAEYTEYSPCQECHIFAMPRMLDMISTA